MGRLQYVGESKIAGVSGDTSASDNDDVPDALPRSQSRDMLSQFVGVSPAKLRFLLRKNTSSSCHLSQQGIMRG
jgi:hypothetical protein